MNQTSVRSENSEQRLSDSGKTRRNLFNRIWSLLAVLAFIQIGWLGGSIIKSKRTRKALKEKDSFVTAGELESFELNSVTAVTQGQFYLARQDDGSFIALSRSCTHLGCSLPWDEKARRFICPCHGSSFDIGGEVLTPPATRGLDSYPIRIENGVILVNIGRPEKRMNNVKPRSVKV